MFVCECGSISEEVFVLVADIDLESGIGEHVCEECAE